MWVGVMASVLLTTISSERASDHEANSAGWTDTIARLRSRTLICDSTSASERIGVSKAMGDART